MASRSALPKLAGVAAAGAIVSLLPSALLAVIATRPALAARVFGGEPNPKRHPSELGLESIDVEYARNCQAWWIPMDGAVATVVIVHGFETALDPRATDPGPRLELASILHAAGYNTLVISLGYGTRVRPHSGGSFEADDVIAAVSWASDRGAVPVAVFGFSAGGNASVAAAHRADLVAVITDSSFVDFGEVLTEQGSAALSAPPWMFGGARSLMKMLTGREPIDLEHWPIDRRIPMLHIHGDADEAISFDNLERLASLTGGERLAVDGADHIESLSVDPDRYSSAVLAFLERALGPA